MNKPTTRETVIDAATPHAPPAWALLERQLLEAQSRACEHFYARYFDDRGYLLCVPRWSGDDGPDDAIENVLNWTVLHALGGSNQILDMYKKALDGHLRQYTEAKTTEVELGRDGMYYQEFHVCFDWFHHGEAWSVIFLQGLSDPYDDKLIRRMRRWVSWYMGDDAHIANYDKRHKVIRSFFNGSRGPLLRKATALDWAGDPIEVEGRFDTAHGETSYQEMLDHFRDYTDAVGDNHVNLGATTLGLVAYALTGDQRYRDWMLEYVDAWVDRTRQNGGLIPSSVGPDGRIESGYGWYGGVYGWGFSVMQIPWKGEVAHRAYHTRTPFSFANALLMTGDRGYVDLFRQMIDTVNSNAKQVDGQTLYPHMYGRLDRLDRVQKGEAIEDLPAEGPTGWYEYRPRKFAPSADALWYWTLDRSNLELAGETPRWARYLDGDDSAYPEAALRAEIESLRAKVEGMRADHRSPDMLMSDDMHRFNPATTGVLTQLMLGGMPTGRDMHVLHAQVRYFDPVNRRAGLPAQVGALVEQITESGVTLGLVNLDPVDERIVIVQGGAYAEHQILRVRSEAVTEEPAPDSDGMLLGRSLGHGRQEMTPETPTSIEVSVDHSHFTVRLAPGAGTRLTIALRRYANQPTFAFPWV
ncbi:MAG: hypothetical protein EPO26_04910 [Chloroflexota bacterium]|nr:MAG: hypothetical protein EPO26_04910 [Chloroflexota bacterium]